MKKIISILIIILAILGCFGIGYTIVSKNMAASNKNNQKNVNSSSKQNNTKTENNQASDYTNAQQISIGKWTINISNEFKEEKNSDSPWYEKRYVNSKGVSLLAGYYEQNGIDDESDKQVFEAAINEYDEDLIEAYGKGDITHKDIDYDKNCSTIYYRTSKQKILTRSMVKDKIWKTITIQLPLSENENNYKDILNNIK